jgi:aspartyl-tRNA(Asn)/glutamyl-tRNA(Gln) amidotransferase subunit B
MFETGGDPRAIVEERGLKQVTDTAAIEAIVDKLIADNPGQVATVQKNPKVAGWFTGQVMKATGGKANPGVVNAVVAKKLGLGG